MHHNDIFSADWKIENDIVIIRALLWEDFELLLPICINEPDLLQFSPPSFGDEASLRTYFKVNLNLRDKELKTPFIIYDKSKNKYAGTTSYLNISFQNERIEIGSTWIGRAFQRTGLNRNCKYLLLSYAFEQLNMKRVELKTDFLNSQSRQAIEGIGGQFEGVLKSHTVMSDGRRRDTVYYGILAEDWPNIKSTIFKNFII